MQNVFFSHYFQLDKPDSSSEFFEALGQKNIVCIMNTKNYKHKNFTGSLSIKSTFKGEEVYQVDDILLNVNPSNYLLLNNGQRYSNFVNSEEEITALTIFFGLNYLENVTYTYTASLDMLLDNVYDIPSKKIIFFQNLNLKTTGVYMILNRIKEYSLKNFHDNGDFLNTLIYKLAFEILKDHKNIIVENVQHISATRKVTRVELFRRISKAKDYINSSLHEETSLKKLATVSNLSVFHFIRVFKEVYKLTPHQYILNQRVCKAKELLRTSKLTASEIAQRVGFQDVESFYRLFSTKERFPPSHFRN